MKVYICQNFVVSTFNGLKRRTEKELQLEKDEIIENLKKAFPMYSEVETYNRNLGEDSHKEISSLGLDIGHNMEEIMDTGLIIFSNEYYQDPYCNVIQYLAQLYNIRNLRAFELKYFADNR